MDIKQLIYFKTIVEEGTISKAAEVLHMAQPPLSMQLKQLEEELGTQLLKRGHRKVELTTAGKLLYKRSLQMIDLHELIYHEIKDTQKEVLRIGITSSNSSHIKYFYNNDTTLTYHIYEGTTYEIIDLLHAHTIDIGIIRTPFDHSDVKAIYLLKEPMLAIGNQKLLNKKMTHMTDYKQLPLIIHQRYLNFISDYCLQKHFYPYVHITSDDCRSSILYAQYGYGIAIIPKSAESLIQNKDIIKVELKDLELYTSVAIITRKNENTDSKLQTLIQKFINNYRKKD